MRKTFSDVNVNFWDTPIQKLVFPDEGEIVDTFQQAVGHITEEMKRIMFQKQSMRGKGNIKDQGLQGVIDRIQYDKMGRIKTYLQKHRDLETFDRHGMAAAADSMREEMDRDNAIDSLDDDLIDIANYCIIAVMLRRGSWDLPFARGTDGEE